MTPWAAACQTPLFCTVSQSLIKFIFMKLVMLSNHLILCCPLLLLPSVFLSIRVFANEFALCIRWPQYAGFSISPSNECSGLISFRLDWLYLCAVQGTLKSLLQHHNLKASVLQRSVSFMVQLSHPYMITGKTIALTMWTFVRKVIFLLFNLLSRFVIAFLPRSKRLLISWLQSPSAVILEPKKIKSVTVSTFCPSICMKKRMARLQILWPISGLLSTGPSGPVFQVSQGPSYSVVLKAGPAVGWGQFESWVVLRYQREHVKISALRIGGSQPLACSLLLLSFGNTALTDSKVCF